MQPVGWLLADWLWISPCGGEELVERPIAALHDTGNLINSQIDAFFVRIMTYEVNPLR
jgi:hypothetical protein